MEHKMLIVVHADRYYGPFLDYETASFMSKLDGESKAIPLHVPRLDNKAQGTIEVHLVDDKDYRSQVDAFKVDTCHMLAGMTQEFYFARREERVFTAREIVDMWDDLFLVSRAVESLMHYVENVLSDPSSKNLESLRKAFWRNRDSDDVDAHYSERFW